MVDPVMDVLAVSGCSSPQMHWCFFRGGKRISTRQGIRQRPYRLRCSRVGNVGVCPKLARPRRTHSRAAPKMRRRSNGSVGRRFSRNRLVLKPASNCTNNSSFVESSLLEARISPSNRPLPMVCSPRSLAAPLHFANNFRQPSLVAAVVKVWIPRRVKLTAG